MSNMILCGFIRTNMQGMFSRIIQRNRENISQVLLRKNFTVLLQCVQCFGFVSGTFLQVRVS